MLLSPTKELTVSNAEPTARERIDRDMPEAMMLGDGNGVGRANGNRNFRAKLSHTTFTPTRNGGILPHKFSGKRYSYHNYTGTKLLLVERSGLPVTIFPIRQPSNNPELRSFTIRVEYYYDNIEILNQICENIRALGVVGDCELALFLSTFSDLKLIANSKLPANDGAGSFSTIYTDSAGAIALEYTFELKDITAANGSLYHFQTDYVISSNTVTETISHPFSTSFNKVGNPLETIFPLKDGAVHFSVRYFSSNRNNSKYIRVCGKIIRLEGQYTIVPRQIEVSKKNGGTEIIETTEYLEIMYPGELDSGFGCSDGKYRVERILANGSGEKFEIYDTYDDATKPANAHGRIEDALKSRVNELTLEIKYATEDIQRLKASHLAEMNALKLKWDEDKDKHARERIKLGDEYATLLRKFELEEEKLKVLRDHQLHSMKVSGESTRYIFTTIAAIIGLIPLLMKFTAK